MFPDFVSPVGKADLNRHRLRCFLEPGYGELTELAGRVMKGKKVPGRLLSKVLQIEYRFYSTMMTSCLRTKLALQRKNSNNSGSHG